MAASRSAQAEHALRRFGLKAKLEPLTGYQKNTFLARADDGAKYVLRIKNESDGDAPLALQLAAIRALANSRYQDHVPRIVLTDDGESVVHCDDCDACLLGWLPGVCLGNRHHEIDDELIRDLANLVAGIANVFSGQDAMDSFMAHSLAIRRNSIWDLAQVLQNRVHLDLIEDDRQRELVDSSLNEFEHKVLPLIQHLPKSLIHGDINDFNLLIDDKRITGLIDFGDVIVSACVLDLAIAAAYVIRDDDPLRDLVILAGAYHDARPLTGIECDVIFCATKARLCTTILRAEVMKRERPGNEYHQVHVAPAWRRLEAMCAIIESEARCRLRHTCGHPPSAHSTIVCEYLQRGLRNCSPVLIGDHDYHVIDLSGRNRDVNAGMTDDSALFSRFIDSQLDTGQIGVGRYLEDRQFYTSEAFDTGQGRRRSVHLGIDLFAPAGSSVHAPIDGTVHSFANNSDRLNYGPTIVLEHHIAAETGSVPFYTLYGHLGAESIQDLKPGQAIRVGQAFAELGAPPVNGDWPPHLHFQIMSEMLGRQGDFPGVADRDDLEFWRGICPDPNLLLRLPVKCTGDAADVPSARLC